MLHGRPAIGKRRYIRIKLHEETHAKWISTKKFFDLKSDDALAEYFLSGIDVNREANVESWHEEKLSVLVFAHIITGRYRETIAFH